MTKPAPGPRHRRARTATATLAVVALLAVPSSAVAQDEGYVVTQPLPAGVPQAGEAPQASGASARTSGLFSASSVWRQDVSDAGVNARSRSMVRNLVSQVEDDYGGVAAFNVRHYNTTFYVASSDTDEVDVAFDDCQGKGYTPKGLRGPDGQFANVPIPSDAVPANGSDGQLTVYSPSEDELWEFWRAKKTSSGWEACWGGRIDDVSQSPGYFDDGFGASASGLAVSGGSVAIREAEAGRIDHALSLALPDVGYWKDFSYPAQRSDGNDRSSDAIPTGTRFRLDPDLDVDQLDLTPVAAMIAKAAQTYGFIVTDKAGTVSVVAESGDAVKARTGTDPWDDILAGTPSYAVMANFPWADLQALPEDWHKPAS